MKPSERISQIAKELARKANQSRDDRRRSQGLQLDQDSFNEKDMLVPALIQYLDEQFFFKKI